MRQFISIFLIFFMVVTSGHARNSRHHPHAAPPSPSPSAVDCSMIIYDMADCLSFLSVGSEDEKPTKSCCEGFKLVLDVDVDCICEAMRSSEQLGIELNMTKAAALPPACGISAPPTICDASPAPGSSPANSPTSPPTNSPSHPPSGSQSPVTPVAVTPALSPKSGSGTLSFPISFLIFTVVASSACL